MKNIVSLKDWNRNYNNIVFKYASDIYISQLREIEMLQEKLNVLRDSENYVGKYFSKAYINRSVLGFSEEQIKTMQAEITEEAKEKPQEGKEEGEEEGVEQPQESLQLLQ